MGQEIGNELDEQNGKDKIFASLLCKTGICFFSPLIQLLLLPTKQAADTKGLCSGNHCRSCPFITWFYCALLLSLWAVSSVKHLGCFPKPDLWTKRLVITGPKHGINFVLYLLHFSVLWQFLWVAGLHLSILILCLSWLTEWKSLEPAIKAALHCLLQRIGFGRVCGPECRSNKVILNQESTCFLSQEPGAKWNCSPGKSAVLLHCAMPWAALGEQILQCSWLYHSSWNSPGRALGPY